MAATRWIDIDTAHAVPKDLVCVPPHYVDDVECVLVSHGMLSDRIRKLAQDVAADTHGPLVTLCVLKGAQVFFAELMRHLAHYHAHSVDMQFVRVKSYVNDQSSGSATISGIDLAELAGKDVLVVEDIVDTGKSAVALMAMLKEAQPKRLRFASLFLKKTKAWNGYVPDYVGFAIPDAFVVGYGLDYNEHFRDLPHLCIISEQGKAKYRLPAA